MKIREDGTPTCLDSVDVPVEGGVVRFPTMPYPLNLDVQEALDGHPLGCPEVAPEVRAAALRNLRLHLSLFAAGRD